MLSLHHLHVPNDTQLSAVHWQLHVQVKQCWGPHNCRAWTHLTTQVLPKRPFSSCLCVINAAAHVDDTTLPLLPCPNTLGATTTAKAPCLVLPDSSLQLHMQVTQESLFLTLTNGNTFASTFASFAASLLGVNVSYIEVTDLTLDPGTTITSTTQASISVRGDFIVAPADSYSADMVSRKPVPEFFA